MILTCLLENISISKHQHSKDYINLTQFPDFRLLSCFASKCVGVVKVTFLKPDFKVFIVKCMGGIRFRTQFQFYMFKNRHKINILEPQN